MSLRELMMLIRKRLLWVLIAAMLTALAAGLFLKRRPKQYSAQLFIDVLTYPVLFEGIKTLPESHFAMCKSAFFQDAVKAKISEDLEESVRPRGYPFEVTRMGRRFNERLRVSVKTRSIKLSMKLLDIWAAVYREQTPLYHAAFVASIMDESIFEARSLLLQHMGVMGLLEKGIDGVTPATRQRMDDLRQEADFLAGRVVFLEQVKSFVLQRDELASAGQPLFSSEVKAYVELSGQANGYQPPVVSEPVSAAGGPRISMQVFVVFLLAFFIFLGLAVMIEAGRTPANT